MQNVAFPDHLTYNIFPGSQTTTKLFFNSSSRAITALSSFAGYLIMEASLFPVTIKIGWSSRNRRKLDNKRTSTRDESNKE